MRSIHRQRGWIPAAIGAAAAIGGGLLANEARSDEASFQRDYQTQMANTAWQRAVQDMKAAGLNPMLAYSQGPAASMPGAQPPHLENIGLAAVQGAQAGAVAEQESAQAERTRAETMTNERLSQRLDAEIDYLVAQQATSSAQYNVNVEHARVLGNEARIKLKEAESAEAFLRDKNAAELQVIKGEAAMMRNRQEIDETQFGYVLRVIERVIQSIGSGLAGAVGGVVGGALVRRGGVGLRQGGGTGVRPPRQTSPEYFRSLRRE